METKADIRHRILEQRRALSIEYAKDLSERICRHILQQEAFLQADTVYGYLSIQKEADIKQVLLKALAMGKKVALPRVEGKTMGFYQIQDFSQVEPGGFQVLEPKRECPPLFARGMMLVPLVAFDYKGNRIGYGKGYYDRYIRNHRSKDQGLEPLVGIGYELQRADRIPMEAFDYPLDCLVTEKGWKKRG